jgi:hypothetical protein
LTLRMEAAWRALRSALRDCHTITHLSCLRRPGDEI